MASPPYAYSPSALSPPLPSPAPLPNKKRGADGGTGQPATLKRRKMSTMSAASAASHPLRQTSFPPEEAGYGARSPSVDNASIVSGSQVSAAPAGGGTRPKKKRGRKSKAEKEREAAEGSRAPTVVSGVSGVGGKKDGGASTVGGPGGPGGEQEDDDDDTGPQNTAMTVAARTAEQKQEEVRMRAMLVGAFDSQQMDRYEAWRAAKLSDAVIKRVVNATVSQSVAPSVVLAVKSVTKLFIGDLIESARRAQGEWIAAGDRQTDLPTPPPSADDIINRELGDAPPTPPPSTVDDRRGPLRPDHLREAYRRYRKGQEGGGVGMRRLWHDQQQTGVERFGARTGGRRLFK